MVLETYTIATDELKVTISLVAIEQPSGKTASNTIDLIVSVSETTLAGLVLILASDTTRSSKLSCIIRFDASRTVELEDILVIDQ
jgi:hypothetical protein